MTTLAELTTARAAAGSTYATAVAALQAALIDLAALDAALANRNIANNGAAPPAVTPPFLGDLGGEPQSAAQTFRKLPPSLADLEHPTYAPALRVNLADAIRQARDVYVASFAP